MSESSAALTGLLARAAEGDADATDELAAQVYPTLHRLAHRQLNAHRRETLSTTDLTHEAYLRLFGPRALEGLENRGHLYAAAARVMRHVLVDYARRKNASKRGGDLQRVTLADTDQPNGELAVDILVLDAALDRLQQADQRCFRVVELRFFGGCTNDEVADYLGVSVMTVKRDWRKARAFLYADMDEPS
ncbi:MAG: ECF-type sigma factor [Xanthomonadales bacterium]|nr:ECF-type sigma factor [Xanthomonadales bacterium]